MSTPEGQQPGLKASFESVNMDFPALVIVLRDLISAKLVAYIGQANDTSLISRWASGEATPSESVQKRIRNTYLIAGTLSERDSKTLVQTWFQGTNPYLEDQSPAQVMRKDQEGDWRRVLAAARAFRSSELA